MTDGLAGSCVGPESCAICGLVVLPGPPLALPLADEPLTLPPFWPISPPTMLLAPPLTLPVAVEFVTVPFGKLEPGIVFGAKLVNTALAATSPATTLLSPLLTLLLAVELLTEPKFSPTRPAAVLWAPVPVTVAVDSAVA